MLNLVIFPIIFFFLHTSPPLIAERDIEEREEGTVEIYLIKQYWHTAIVVNRDDIDSLVFPEVTMFSKFRMIDFGWGDEEFYQYDGFDAGLAYKALFYGTPSTLRVEGIGISKEAYFNVSEIVIKIVITLKQLDEILKFISDTVYRDSNGNPVVLSERGLGRIKFFKANGEYHLFNTCNTWLATGLKQAGVNITDDIILTEELFNEAAKIGTVIKAE